MDLFLLRYEAKKLHARGEVKRLDETLQLRPIIAGAGDLESGSLNVQISERANDVIDLLVPLEPAQVNEERMVGALTLIRRVGACIHSVVDDADALPRDAARDKIIRGALAHGLEWRVAIHDAERLLG